MVDYITVLQPNKTLAWTHEHVTEYACFYFKAFKTGSVAVK